MNAPVGRLAPSPTGLLHLGHARTFLLAFWHIRSRAGQLLLRMEDLDGPRAEMRFADAALSDLTWLGLEWDGPVYVQSTGIERLNAALATLLDQGKAYPCVCSRGDIRSAQSAPHAGALEPRYPGTCRGRYSSLAEAEQQSGRAAGARLLVPDGSIGIDDGVSGESTWDVAQDVGDFLIAKRDGAPAYQLAVAVDDHAQGVTEVLRGADLLPSAARQWHVQNALGLPHPAWFHVPLVTDATGRRLAKRENDLSLAELRNGGTDPRAIVAWAARSSGLAVDDRVSAREVTPAFQLSAVPKEPVPLEPELVAALKAAR
ncbi:MAG TPA: tRNA glutamyl-Q(34) synthetase GluQRS [Polyangiaceae bacterium]|jgi:glutamyl-tRNA synthetase|nr:tRNA glutamyl-Q(34) synthetase GluQRS [Polyangiaceae bacterium]